MPVVIHGGGTIEGISVGGLPNGIVDTDMIAANAVTTAKSTVTPGITQMDQWRYTTTGTAGNQDPISSNLERNDTDFDKIGDGMSESSGIFTFPSTGLWWVKADAVFQLDGQSSQYEVIQIQCTTDNSNYNVRGDSMTSDGYGGIAQTVYLNASCSTVFDVTNVSTHKVKFKVTLQTTSNNKLIGSTSKNMSTFTFIRLGDT